MRKITLFSHAQDWKTRKTAGRCPTPCQGILVKASSLREDGFAAALSWRCSYPWNPISKCISCICRHKYKIKQKTACSYWLSNVQAVSCIDLKFVPANVYIYVCHNGSRAECPCGGIGGKAPKVFKSLSLSVFEPTSVA